MSLRRSTPLLVLSASTVSLLFAAPSGPSPAAAPPQPRPAARAILDAFDHAPVVAIGEMHWLQNAGDFYVALINTPGFADHVNDIVVEFSTPRYQPLLDRYVNGEDIPPAQLAEVWRNTTKVFAWESPIYPQLLAAVRNLNRTLPPQRRVRVLGGDAPIDWTQIETHQQWAAFQPNNNAFAQVITRQVLARHRHALVILGGNHLTRGGDRDKAPDTTTLVEKQFPNSMYIILQTAGGFGEDSALMQPWKAPAVAPVTSSWAAKIPYGSRVLADSADAVLYLGPNNTLTQASPPWNTYDATILHELDRRSHIEWGCSFDLNRWKQSMRPCP